MNSLVFVERPRRRDPADFSPDGDIYASTAQERASVVQCALDSGVTAFHAEHEREAASLGVALRTLGIRDGVTLSTTDGDALDRCLDDENDAARAINAALARKRQLLGVEFIDCFLLYDFRRGTHTPTRLAGAVKALDAAVRSGQIGSYGATCFDDFDALSEAIAGQNFSPQRVMARYNYPDQRAADTLFPVCRARHIPTLAAQTFSWLGGVPFVHFPNCWRFRNLTKNFYGITAAQAHLRWVLSRSEIDGAACAMQTKEQVKENAEAVQKTTLPTGIESLFQEFRDAIATTNDGWRGLLTDENWEYRQAAQAWLAR